jgi:hypothetical protein
VKIHVSDPKHTFHSCYNKCFIYKAMVCEKRLTGIYKIGDSTYMTTKTLFQMKSPFGEYSHGIQMSSTFILSILTGLSLYLLLQFVCQQFSNYVPFKCLPTWQVDWIRPTNQCVFTCMTISIFNCIIRGTT